MENGVYIKPLKVNYDKIEAKTFKLTFDGVQSTKTIKPGQKIHSPASHDFGKGVFATQSEAFRQRKAQYDSQKSIAESYDVFQKLAQMKEDRRLKVPPIDQKKPSESYPELKGGSSKNATSTSRMQEYGSRAQRRGQAESGAAPEGLPVQSSRKSMHSDIRDDGGDVLSVEPPPLDDAEITKFNPTKQITSMIAPSFLKRQHAHGHFKPISESLLMTHGVSYQDE